ncbi:MAG: ACP S-malonyltransferase [Acinetobacter sp.]|nr:ACP S-malonyltransferase [Acinetobacter sp.]
MTSQATSSSLAFVFPGQGSQKVGMLAELAEQYPIIQQTFAEASQAVGFDLWAIAQSGEGLDLTENTQPILLTASIALWRVYQSLSSVQPAYLAGHSLGEYSALVAGGALDFADAVKLVHLRGQLMQNAVAAGEGSMAAILALSDEQVKTLCQDVQANADSGSVEVANYNTKGQVVIAGHTALIQAAMAQAKEQGGKAIALPVSVPSHCSLMKPAAEQFAQALANTKIQLPTIPVIQNTNVQIATSVEQLRQALTEQLYQSVQWTATMQFLQEHGVKHIVECGAGNVLTNLAKRLDGIEFALATDTVSRLQDAIEKIA